MVCLTTGFNYIDFTEEKVVVYARCSHRGSIILTAIDVKNALLIQIGVKIEQEIHGKVPYSHPHNPCMGQPTNESMDLGTHIWYPPQILQGHHHQLGKGERESMVTSNALPAL